MNHLLFYRKENQILLLILPLISSFFFLSNFQISKYFISLFSGTDRHTKLKLDTHMGKGLIYCVHQKQAARIYMFFHFSSFFFCLSNWQRLKTCFYKLFQYTSDGNGRGYVSFAHSLLYYISVVILKFSIVYCVGGWMCYVLTCGPRYGTMKRTKNCWDWSRNTDVRYRKILALEHDRTNKITCAQQRLGSTWASAFVFLASH